MSSERLAELEALAAQAVGIHESWALQFSTAVPELIARVRELKHADHEADRMMVERDLALDMLALQLGGSRLLLLKLDHERAGRLQAEEEVAARLCEAVQAFLEAVATRAESPEAMARALEDLQPGWKAPDGPALLVCDGWASDRIGEVEAKLRAAEEEVARLQALIAEHESKTVCECPECASDEFGVHRPGCPWGQAAAAHRARVGEVRDDG